LTFIGENNVIKMDDYFAKSGAIEIGRNACRTGFLGSNSHGILLELKYAGCEPVSSGIEEIDE